MGHPAGSSVSFRNDRRKASATARAEEDADPCGMTTKKANATARAKEDADPCGMTTKKANATARAKATTGVLRLRAARFAQDDGENRERRSRSWEELLASS
jgi:hypothetical protein